MPPAAGKVLVSDVVNDALTVALLLADAPLDNMESESHAARTTVDRYVDSDVNVTTPA